MRTITTLTTSLVLAVGLGACGNVGGGEMVVHGNDNTIVQDQAIDRLAATLARFDATPRVSDADIVAIYDQLRTDALEGDLEAALVVLKVAAIQREPRDAD